MSKIQTTNDIKSDENDQVQMTAETYRFVMSWNYYPEPITGERQVKLEVNARIPDFSVLNFKDGIKCFPAYGSTVLEQNELKPGAGFCEGNQYGEKSKPNIGKAVSLKCWQTQSSKEAWNERIERLQRKEAASIERTVSPEVPHVCVMCRDLDPSKKACKLSEQSMASLCSLHNRHRRLIVTPAHKKQSPYRGSLRQKLDQFEKKNRPAKIWHVSTLPTINRNDGKFLRYNTNEADEPIRVYQDSNPRLVPEIALAMTAQKIARDMMSAHSLMTGVWILQNPAGAMILCSWISMVTAKSSGSVSICLSPTGYLSPEHAAYSLANSRLTIPRTNTLSSIKGGTGILLTNLPSQLKNIQW